MECRYIPKINPNSVHLWYIPLKSEEPLEKFISFLSADELQKVNNFHFLHLKRSYILRRYAIKQILGKYCNIEARHVKINYTKHQKPYLQHNPYSLQFNISNSNNLAILAITMQDLIGVDIEHLRPMEDIASIAQQFFSKAEFSKFVALPTSEQLKAFYTIWTRKEAFVKAIGKGLSYPLHKFNVAFLPTESMQLLAINDVSLKAKDWALHGFNFNHLDEQYIGAIVTKNQRKKVIFFDKVIL